MYPASGRGDDASGAAGWFDRYVETDRRQVQRALLLAVTVFALGSVIVGFSFHSSTGVVVPQWMRFATLATVCVALAFRRLAPQFGLVVGTVGFFTDAFIGMSIATMAIYTDNIYSATLRGPKHLPRLLLILATVVSIGCSVMVYQEENGLRVSILVLAVLALILLSPVATGMIVREHRERAALERDRKSVV